MSYKQLANKYNYSIITIQRHIDKMPKTALPTHKNIYLNIIADTTCFGRELGILVLMECIIKTVVYHQIVKAEKDVYYKVAMNKLREQGYVIQSLTYDGRRGLLKDVWETPTQMSQFHLIAIVMRVLRKNHKNYLNEHSDNPNKKDYYPYKYRSLRGAYASLKLYIDYTFTYEKHTKIK